MDKHGNTERDNENENDDKEGEYDTKMYDHLMTISMMISYNNNLKEDLNHV